MADNRFVHGAAGTVDKINDQIRHPFHVTLDLGNGAWFYESDLTVIGDVVSPLQAGDRVRIVSKKPTTVDPDIGWMPDMTQLCGEEGTVTFVDTVQSYYNVQCDCGGNEYTYLREWLEKL